MDKKIEKMLSEVGTNKEESLLEMMLILVQALEERDEYTRGHSERVATLAMAIGQKLGMNKRNL